MIGICFWIFTLGLQFLGTLIAVLTFRRTRPSRPFAQPQPVSILKPVKGIDGNLLENLRSFFELEGRFELILSVADRSDPAVELIHDLMRSYPFVRARLVITVDRPEINPKVANLFEPYRIAAHEWILISDSNVRVPKTYLRAVTERFTEDVGVVTAVVSGRDPRGVGAWLEAISLNTFYARWMMISRMSTTPVVLGKSMLFRKRDLERFGGLETLSGYLAEDYMSGAAMKYLNLRVEVMAEPVLQHLERYSFREFWSRHLRWGRIRKFQAPLIFALEPLGSFWIAGAVGVGSAHATLGWSLVAAGAVHTCLYFLADWILMRTLGLRVGPLTFLTWCARELIHVPLWLHICLGNRVNWRGKSIELAPGGLIQNEPMILQRRPSLR